MWVQNPLKYGVGQEKLHRQKLSWYENDSTSRCGIFTFLPSKSHAKGDKVAGGVTIFLS